MEIETAFSYPDPGADWWEATGAQLGLDTYAIKFTAALHALGGADARKNTQAARVAGLALDRTQAFRLARSVAVRKLLDAAQEIKSGKRPPVSEQEVDEAIDRLIRAPDALTVARGIEFRQKRQSHIGGDLGQSKLEHPADIFFHVISGCNNNGYRKELWPLVWMEMVLPDAGWNAPLIRQMAPYLAANHANLWDGAKAKLAFYRPDHLKQIEAGPVLTVAEIFELSRKNIMPLMLVLDSSTTPEPRGTAERDLIRAGLMEEFA